MKSTRRPMAPETEFRGASTRWIPQWTGAQGVKAVQPAGKGRNRAGDHQQPESIEESLDREIRQLGAGSLPEARRLGTAQKRRLAVKLHSGYPVRLICRLLDLPRSTYYYQVTTHWDASLDDALRRVMRDHPGYGYRRIAIHLRQEGWEVSAKRVYLMMLRGLEA